MFRNAHRPGVVRSVSPAALVATLIAEDLVSEHDHMVVAVPEIRISAALCQQRPGERFRQHIGNIIVGLEFQECPDRRLAHETDADTSCRLTRVRLTT